MSSQAKASPDYAIVGETEVPEPKAPEGAELYFKRNADGTITCNHCGYTVRPRVDFPKRCSRCQRDLWNWRTLGMPNDDE